MPTVPGRDPQLQPEAHPGLHPDLDGVLITAEQIRQRVRELGEELSRDYRGREVHVVSVLRGASIFTADLLRALSVSTVLDFIAVSSYGSDTRSSGVVRILKDLNENVEGAHVLLVEDIIDTGLTLNYLAGMLRDRKVASLEVCALLDKPDRREVESRARYVGFTIPNAFVVGYGLDYNQRYRGLPYIGTLRPEIYGGR